MPTAIMNYADYIVSQLHAAGSFRRGYETRHIRSLMPHVAICGMLSTISPPPLLFAYKMSAAGVKGQHTP